jgi:multidrug efflux pump subunit AcrA (membrane-fusion protein)
MDLSSKLGCQPITWALDCRSCSLILGALLLASGCDSPVGGFDANRITSRSAAILTVNVMEITRDDNAIETAVFYGTLEPNRESRLGFARGGRIKQVLKQVGDQASAGEKLAELQQEPLEKQRQEIDQRLQTAQNNLQNFGPGGQAPIQQEIQQLESQREALDLELAQGIVLAPYECIVAERYVDVGDQTSLQSPILDVIDNAPPVVKANLPSKIANKLQIDQSVWVGVGQFAAQAQVKHRSPIESTVGSKTVSLQITSSLEADTWSYGQSVKIRFFLPTTKSGFWLPLTALNRESSGLWSVLVVPKRDDSPETTADEPAEFLVDRKILELVQLEDDWALVEGSLQNGERVIVNGLHRVVPGQRVKISDITAQYSKPGAGATE